MKFSRILLAVSGLLMVMLVGASPQLGNTTLVILEGGSCTGRSQDGLQEPAKADVLGCISAAKGEIRNNQHLKRPRLLKQGQFLGYFMH